MKVIKLSLIIIGIFIFLFAMFSLIIPVKEVMVDDRYLYGDYFCDTYDNSCIPTHSEGRDMGNGIIILEETHSTSETFTLFEYFKYKSWIEKTKYQTTQDIVSNLCVVEMRGNET